MNDVDTLMQLQKIDYTPKMLIVYCTHAGLISALIISGLLEVIDFASGTPSGTFFAVIGLSLGFNDPASAQYIGYGLHILTGTVAGNIFGQMALFWRRLIPYNMKRGVSLGLILGISLWAVLFAPLATFGIQPKLDTFMITEANTLCALHSKSLCRTVLFRIGCVVTIPSSLWRCLWITGRKNDRSKARDAKGY